MKARTVFWLFVAGLGIGLVLGEVASCVWPPPMAVVQESGE